MGRVPHWYQEAIIYELHVKCFYDHSGDGIGDFKGLTEKLDYLQDLGITAIWLLPFYPSPLKDDGYDIADYTDVHSLYGNLDDFRCFLYEAHRRGLKVVTELVINHTSDQHPWFQRARRAPIGSRERDYYVWSDTPDRYKETRIIFQDFESSNWSWDPLARSYYWHRFYSHQPDLNFDNPDVQQAIFERLSFWLEMGVDGMRLDAIPYLYEREGTNCENLPETHGFLKKLRAYVDAHFEDRMLLAEANQWPEDAAKYFGEGDECHMSFHFPVMPRLFMSIHLEDSLPIREIMSQTPEIPEECQWALFLRNHDELTLEMVTDEERDYMFRVYAHDPQARINLGIRRRLAPLLKNDRRKMELMNALLFSLTGTPVLYYGDELGMGDNIYLGDRDSVRTPMQWSSDRNAGFSRANPQQLYLPTIIDPEYHYETVNVEAQLGNPHSLLWWTKQLISLRKHYRAFSLGTTRFLIPRNQKVLVFFREYDNECLLVVANLSRFPQFVELDLEEFDGFRLVEMFSGQHFPSVGTLPYFLTLGSYGYYWFALEKQPEMTAQDLIQKEIERRVFKLPEGFDPHSLFSDKERQMLQRAVRKYLQKRAWFNAYWKQWDRTKFRLLEVQMIERLQVGFVMVEFALQSGEIHHLPLFLRHYRGHSAHAALESTPESVVVTFEGGDILLDLSEEPHFVEMMETMIERQEELGKLRGVLLSNKEEAPNFNYFRVLDEGMPLDVEMRQFLKEHSTFEDFYPLLGYVEYSSPANIKFALAEQVAGPKAPFNAHELAKEAAGRFLIRMEALGPEMLSEELLLPSATLTTLANREIDPKILGLLDEYLEVALLLGETTAQFHLALGNPSNPAEFAPESFTLFFQRSIYQTLRKKVALGFDRLRLLAPEGLSCEIEHVLRYKEPLLKGLEFLPHEKIGAERIRIHGHYVLENLHYTGKSFILAELSGDPRASYHERRYKRSPLCDCASMLLSITQASFEAAKEMEARGGISDLMRPQLTNWALSWSMWIGSSFLKSYLKSLRKSSLIPEEDKEIDLLLMIFLIERCAGSLAFLPEEAMEVSVRMLHLWLPRYESTQFF